MKNKLLVILFIALALMMAGCGAEEEPAPTAVSEPTAVEQVASPTEEEAAPTEKSAPAQESEQEAEPTAEEEVATPEPEPTPSPIPIVVVDVDSACVNCHTDTERLKELAEEPEGVELSSGEG